MVSVACRECGNLIVVPATSEQVARWKAGELIQNAMPNLTPDEREVLISGICSPCFDNIFKDDDEN